MSSAGSRDRLPWMLALAAALGICGLAFAATAGAQAVGVLGAIIAPPEPPVPNTTQVESYTRAAHGVDTWTYNIADTACAVVAFYQANNGLCAVRAGWCDGDDPGVLDVSVAQCIGSMSFSIFQMRWRAEISAGAAPGTARLELAREVSWTGGLPPETPALR